MRNLSVCRGMIGITSFHDKDIIAFDGAFKQFLLTKSYVLNKMNAMDAIRTYKCFRAGLHIYAAKKENILHD